MIQSSLHQTLQPPLAGKGTADSPLKLQLSVKAPITGSGTPDDPLTANISGGSSNKDGIWSLAIKGKSYRDTHGYIEIQDFEVKLQRIDNIVSIVPFDINYTASATVVPGQISPGGSNYTVKAELPENLKPVASKNNFTSDSIDFGAGSDFNNYDVGNLSISLGINLTQLIVNIGFDLGPGTGSSACPWTFQSDKTYQAKA